MARRPHARILADFCQVQKILVTKKQMLRGSGFLRSCRCTMGAFFARDFQQILLARRTSRRQIRKCVASVADQAIFCPKEKMGVDAKCTNRAERV